MKFNVGHFCTVQRNHSAVIIKLGTQDCFYQYNTQLAYSAKFLLTIWVCTVCYSQGCWMCVDSVRNYTIENTVSIINEVRSKETHEAWIPVMKLKQYTASICCSAPALICHASFTASYTGMKLVGNNPVSLKKSVFRCCQI
jgi:hypothetical protein